MATKSKLSDFYEDEPDMLAGFRKRYGGPVYAKEGGDAFAGDSDMLQATADQKLTQEFSDAGVSSPIT